MDPPVFRLLGRVEAVSGGRLIDIGSPQRRCVLAALLLRPGRILRIEDLADAVWDGTPPSTARKALQVHVWGLRQALASCPEVRLETHTAGYRLRVPPDLVDLHRFRRHVRTAAGASRAEAAPLLAEALRLWQGVPLTGAGDSRFITDTQRNLERERLAALIARIGADIALGMGERLIPELNELIIRHPLHEEFYELLMRCLRAADRINEALAVFRDARVTLRRELGVRPGPALSALHDELLAASVPTGRPDTGEPHAVTSTLPADIPDFCGRAHEAGQIITELTPRDGGGLPVVVIAGPGGIGKTSLAVRVAHRVAPRFPDGQLYVNLRGSRLTPLTAAEVLARFLRGLGVRGQDIPESTTERAALFRSLLAGRRVLVVLDDAGDAAQVAHLLPGNAPCAVLVTSRSRLPELDSSRLVELDVFSVQEAHELATTVIGRARAEAEPEAMQDILRSCGYFPIAVRLAFGRLAAYGDWKLGRLADELKLTGGVAVRSSFNLSYRALPPDRAQAFRLLSLPESGHIGVPGAAALLGKPPAGTERLLEHLADAYLIRPGEVDRYHYHDLIRSFAREKCAASDSDAARHGALVRYAGFHIATACNAITWVTGSVTFREFDLPGSGGALEFGDAASAARWLQQEYDALTSSATQTVNAPELPVGAFAQLATGLAVARYLGYTPDGSPPWEQGMRRTLERARAEGDEWAAHLATTALGETLLSRREIEGARQHFDAALRYFRGMDDAPGQVLLLCLLGTLYTVTAEFEKSLLSQQDLMTRLWDKANRRVRTTALINGASACNALGRHREALEYLARVRQQGYISENPVFATFFHSNMGGAHRGLGNHTEAMGHYERMLSLAREYRSRDQQVSALLGMSMVHVRSGHPNRGLACFREATAVQGDEPVRNINGTLLRNAADELLASGVVDRDDLFPSP